MCNGRGHSTFIGSKCKGETTGEASFSPIAERPVGLGENVAEADRESPDYFKSWDNSVDFQREDEHEYIDPLLEVRHHITPCRCRSAYCEDCCMYYGIKIRRRLVPIVATWQAVFMVTLTVDPKLYDNDPESAYDDIRHRRLLNRFVERLRELGYLHSNEYFAVVEWQKQTEFPHFHILINATRIPFTVLAREWGRMRPRFAPRWEHSHERDIVYSDISNLKGKSPEFGTVQFSAPRFKSSQHAANYATKYLTKHPQQGYPQWVLNSTTQIKRYATSRGFWRTEKKFIQVEMSKAREKQHSPECFCEECQAGGKSQAGKMRRPNRTIAERLKLCAQQARLTKTIYHRGTDENGQEKLIPIKTEFVRELPFTWLRVKEILGVTNPDVRKIPLGSDEADWIGKFTKLRLSVVGGSINRDDVAPFAEFEEWNQMAAEVDSISFVPYENTFSENYE